MALGQITLHPTLCCNFWIKFLKPYPKTSLNLELGFSLISKKLLTLLTTKFYLKKLEFYGIRGVPNLWFKNYLRERSQFVSINGVDSSEKNIKCGVPQGTVLGPLLFLIFINDMPNSNNFFTLLFADDTTFQISGKDPKILFEIANKELSKAATWFRANKLTLNTSKTKFIVFRKPNMKIDTHISP